MGIINKKEIKRMLEKRKVKAGADAIARLSSFAENELIRKLVLAERSARISGRKIIKKEDFHDLL